MSVINDVLVLGVQHGDSVIHLYVSILFQILYPFSFWQNTEQSSKSYPGWLSSCLDIGHVTPSSTMVLLLSWENSSMQFRTTICLLHCLWKAISNTDHSTVLRMVTKVASVPLGGPLWGSQDDSTADATAPVSQRHGLPPQLCPGGLAQIADLSSRAADCISAMEAKTQRVWVSPSPSTNHFLKYLFIWVHQILVVAHGIFCLHHFRLAGSLVAASGLLVASCDNWFPDQGWNLGPLHWQPGALASAPPGEPLY